MIQHCSIKMTWRYQRRTIFLFFFRIPQIIFLWSKIVFMRLYILPIFYSFIVSSDVYQKFLLTFSLSFLFDPLTFRYCFSLIYDFIAVFFSLPNKIQFIYSMPFIVLSPHELSTEFSNICQTFDIFPGMNKGLSKYFPSRIRIWL